MFTNLFFKVMGLQLKTCALFGGVPYVWNSKLKRVKVTNSSRRNFYFYSILLFIGTFYLGIRSLQTKLWGDAQEFNYVMALFIAGMFDSQAVICCLIDPEYAAYVFNSSILYGIKFKDLWRPKFNPEKSKLNWYMDRLFLFIYILQITAPFFISGHYFLYPKSAAYPFSFLPDILFNPLTYISTGLCYIIMLQSIWSNLTHTSFIFSSYAFIILPILRKEFMPNQTGYLTIGRLRTPRNLTLAYRTLEIWHKNAILLAEPCIIPIQTLVTKLILFCNYMLLTTWKELDGTTTSILLFWSIGACCIWVAVLEVGGWMNSQGKKILNSWKFFNWYNADDKKYLAKFRKSCRPLSIRVQGYGFCIRRVSLIKFLRGIVRGTFRALLALK